MKSFKLIAAIVVLALSFAQSWADETLQLQEVTTDVYAIVGELGNRSRDNLGNNATFGVVVTTAGVVLIDPGGTYRGAKNIHMKIRQVTEKPVVTVINTGGQDHRWLGNGYFKMLGAEIIASADAVSDQKKRRQDQFIMLDNLVGKENISDTQAVYADKTFTDNYRFKIGQTEFEIHHAGPAHTPGDSFVWLPQKEVIFSGDIVYVERMLGVIAVSNSNSWIDVFDSMAAYQPRYLVPGHGKPTDLSGAKKDTYDYLVFLREAVAEFMDDGGDISDIGSVDQSGFDYLENFEILAGRNAQQVYTEIEWE